MSSNFRALIATHDTWTLRIASTGSRHIDAKSIQELQSVLGQLRPGVYHVVLRANEVVVGMAMIAKTKSGLLKEDSATRACQGLAQYCNEHRTTEKSEDSQ
jgi:adenosyl cobinamide kinase/adenosyl cobinamide phosphate guanylyltransferase